MKKSTKIVLLISVCVLAVGALVFYFVAPEMFMNMLNTLTYYINQPLPLVGISVLTLSLIALKIFASTSFGKKALNQIKDEAETFKIEAAKYKKQVEEERELADARVAELEKQYNEKIETVYAQFDYFEKSIFESLEKIPNAKVQEEIKKFKEGYNQRKQEIGLLVNQGYEVVNQKLDEMKAELNEKIEGILNEAKERINNQTTEE